MVSMPHEPVEMPLPYSHLCSTANLAGNEHRAQELLDCAVLRLTTVTYTLVHELVSLVEGPV